MQNFFSERSDAFCYEILLSKAVIFNGNRRSFDESWRIFGAQDAPSACQSFPGSTRVHEIAAKVFRMSVRRLLASCAHVRHRNCACLRSKCARFCVQNFENPHESGQRCTHNLPKRHQQPFDARCTRCKTFSERKDAFCYETLLSKAVIFSGRSQKFR